MYKGSGDDPPPGDASQAQTMQNQEEDQKLLAQLQEMLKKSDPSSVSQEKVAKYANTLSKMKSRAMRSQTKETDSTKKGDKVNETSNEKIKLLRQQLEENKAKLAERGKNQRGIEEKVTKIKAQLDNSQIYQSHTPLNISLIDDRVDYSPSNTSQELYNILLNKDKRLSEMNAKLAKLQANVLDLQENVKEKDSVIDARTKAITLMSENLSKKGKDTLDTLDETKNQMREMQESFILKEEEYRTENESLKTEIEAKTTEISNLKFENEELQLKTRELELSESALQSKITELEKLRHSPSRSPSKSRKGKKGKFTNNKSEKSEVDDSLHSEIEKLNVEKEQIIAENTQNVLKLQEEHSRKMKEMENTIIDLKNQLSDMKNVSNASIIEPTELETLKQQLDEANKNMIKVKAQNKSKVKELNRKIDSFKKISDTNAEIVKLDAENARLAQKVAELEEEIGSLQLTMADSKDVPDSSKMKESKENMKLQQETIEKLEKENRNYQQEISILCEKLENLSTLSNAQVTNDLTSVQYEEQLELLDGQKLKLEEQLKEVKEEMILIRDQCESMKKEKQDLQVKLNNCVQENAELLDRLEKLSAEKLSSAESIEIVENFTQQEKLELEAYQKTLLPKSSMENLETIDNRELNDSVNQLTEETADLLHKIELFTVERREVMEKMESLIAENNKLSLKLKEVENTRDVLEETYEQLQTEKDTLDTKLKDYEKKIKEFKTLSTDIEEYKSFIEIQKQEIQELKIQLISYANEYSKSKRSPIGEDHEKLLKDFEEMQNELKNASDANENYKEIIEENKEELIKYAKLIEEYKEQTNYITVLKEENRQLCDKIQDLNEEILEMNKLNQDSQISETHNELTAELFHLKTSLEENLKQVEEYENELGENSQTIQQLQNQIKDLSNQMQSTLNTLQEKDAEIQSLLNEKLEKDAINENLRKELETKNEIFDGLKQKYLKLQSQFEGNDKLYEPMKERVQVLEQKNKEQIEKMKKIAANLKKRNADYLKLEKTHEETLQELQKQHEIQTGHTEHSERIKNLSLELEKLQNQLTEVLGELHQKTSECSITENKLIETKQENDQVKHQNETLNNQLNAYTAQIEDLQNVVHEYEMQISDLNRELETIRTNANNQSNVERDEAIKRLHEEVEALKYSSETTSNALQMKIHEQEVFIEQQSNELSLCKEQVDSLEEKLAQMEHLRISLEQNAEDLGAEFAENEGKLENRLEALVEQDRIIKSKLEDVLQENDNLHGEIQIVKQENVEYKKQIHSYNVKLQEYEENQEMCAKLSSEKLQQEQKIKDLEMEIRKLNMDLNVVTSETERNENELQEQLDRHSNDRKQLLEQLEIAGDQIQGLIESKEHLNSMVQELIQKLDQQQADFEDTIYKFRNLEEEHKKNLSKLDSVSNLGQDAKSKNLDEIKSLIEKKTEELHVFRQSYVPSPADFFNENTKEKQLLEEIANLNEQLNYCEPITHENTLKETRDELAETKTQLDFAKNMLAQVEENNLVVLNRNDQLEKQVQDLQRLETQKSASLLNEPQIDPFAFVIEPTIENVNVTQNHENKPEDYNEDLEQKLKTLQFMLYNTEREKENALMQCDQLSNELATLIYERQNKTAMLDAQILSDQSNDQALKMHYEPTKDPQECMGDATTMNEESCTQKTAYQCQPDNSAFGEDSWTAFGEEEAKLEREHMEKNEGTEELRRKIEALEMERENNLAELQEAQVKSGRLIKKLKEFKAINERLNAKLKNDDFDGLVDALQDELKSQITALEKRVKELSTELEREKIEKENLVKRIDVLSAANERLVEMKEKQDVEVLAWQHKNRELSAKLENFEWGTEIESPENNPPTIHVSAVDNDNDNKIQELNDVIKDLTLDNEELQTLLEEQRNLRLQAEKAQKITDNSITDVQYKELLTEKSQIEEQCKTLKDENIKLQTINANRLQEELETRDKLNAELLEVQDALKVAQEKLQTHYVEKTQLEASLLESTIQLESLRTELDELQLEVSRKDSEIATFTTQLDNQKSDANHFTQTIQSLENEKESLLQQNRAFEETITQLKKELLDLKSRQESLPDFKALQDEITSLKESSASKEKEHLDALEQLAVEWSRHVEQRGFEVAESWSSHVKTRESEFADLESALRKEINELEEKCNALVNENNELRKNVDAEIRNEVDKISALQKQITDRETNVRALTDALDRKIGELENLHSVHSDLIQHSTNLQNALDTNGEELERHVRLQEDKDRIIKELNEKLSHSDDNKVNEDLMRSLQVQLGEKNAEVESYKLTVDTLRADLERYVEVSKELDANQGLINNYERQIDEHKNTIVQLKSHLERLELELSDYTVNLSNAQGNLQERDYKIAELTNELKGQQQEQASNSQLQQQIHELQQQINSYTIQLQENCLYIEGLNQEIQSYKALKEHAQSKEQEISRLNNLLEEKTSEYEYALQNQLFESQSVLNTQNQEMDALKRRLHETEMKLDDTVNGKDAELNSYKAQLDEINLSLKSVQNDIGEKEMTICELETIVKEDEKQMSELKGIMEEQVLKIEELNGQVYEKSRDYDVLIAEIDDPQKLQSQQSQESKKVLFEDLATAISHQDQDPAALVPKAELELAWYIIHQRDVRCEELTFELMQLLEERDTLQLRLSNEIRENEIYKAQIGANPTATDSAENSGAIPKNIETGPQTSANTQQQEPSIKKSSLANKLSELKIVGYKKDKTLVDESELRNFQQMALLEQHKDDVSKLPPEAAARLIDANYTLSRDVQSPSEVFLNWLWGTSTPKVNNL